MKSKRHSPEQIVKILREGERAESIREVARQHGVSDLRRLKGLQTENAQLKKVVADQALKISLLEEVNSKKW